MESGELHARVTRIGFEEGGMSLAESQSSQIVPSGIILVLADADYIPAPCSLPGYTLMHWTQELASEENVYTSHQLLALCHCVLTSFIAQVQDLQSVAELLNDDVSQQT